MIRDAIAFLLANGPALLPTLPQLTGLAALLAVVAALSVLGGGLRVAAGGDDSLASADLVVGWAVAVAVLVVGGTLFGLALTPLALALALAALASAVLLVRRRVMPLGGGLGWLLLALLPALALTASMRPSEGDDFGTWLPNLRYLALFDHFPGAGLPLSDSQFPAYPPAGTLVGYLTGRLTGTLAETAANHFNLALLAGLALLMIDTCRNAAGAAIRAPGARAVVIALAAATLASPTFVPRLVLANYAETATAVTLAFAAALGLRLVLAEGRPGRGLTLQTALAFALLVLTKQSTLALFGLLALGLALLALRAGGPRRLPRLLAPLLAAAIALLLWKHQVAMLGGGEMRVGAFAQWQWAALPETLGSMLNVAANKAGYFGLAAALVAAGLVLLRRRLDPALAVIPLFGMVFLGFTLFLTWTYLAVFFGYEGRSAASFWRYNTQLGALQLLAVAALAGAGWRRWGQHPAASRLRAAVAALAVAALVVGPVAAIGVLRFDINPVKAHIAATAPEARALLPEGAKIWYVDPPRVGLANQIDYYLGFGVQIAGMITYFEAESLYRPLLDGDRAAFAYVLNATPALEAAVGLALPDGASYLIARDAPGQWHIVRAWPYRGFASARAVKY